MPTRTFEKLLPDKRQRIIDAAIEEFATHVFAEANLDRIAAVSGVAKGSLFQYFADKTDFYIHAVGCALDRAWTFYEQHIARNPPEDCFAGLAQAVFSMAALGKERPHLAALYFRVVYAKDSHARDHLYETYIARNTEVFDELIRSGVEDGLIDPDLPESVVRFHMHAVGSHLIYLVLSGDDPRWLPQGPRRFRSFVFQTVGVLARALAPGSADLQSTGTF